MINSWDGWGENGMAWISFDDFEKLLKAQGEACTATELDLDK
jgi:C1A family cysteine protease